MGGGGEGELGVGPVFHITCFGVFFYERKSHHLKILEL